MKRSIALITDTTNHARRPTTDGMVQRGIPATYRARPWTLDTNDADPYALASVMLAAFSLVIAWFFPLTLIYGPFALAMARSSLATIKRSEGRIGGRTCALLGLFLGVVLTAWLVIFGLAVLGFFGPVTLHGGRPF